MTGQEAERAGLRADLDALCAWSRPPCSPGEAAAADWLAGELRASGCDDVAVVPALGFPFYAAPFAALTAAATLGSRWRTRPLTRAAALAIAAVLADDVENGRRPWRRVWPGLRPTQNVVATIGDGPVTLVVLAHHDAAPTGLTFDQRVPRALLRLTGQDGRSVPFWAPVVAGPLLVALGARRAGGVLSALSTLFLADIARDRTVPGANDNGSAVVLLLALARRLRDDPPPRGVRVVLASCGAEEALQGGVHAFVASLRGDELVLVVDTVGGPRLCLLEGEGELRMEDYADPAFRDRVARVAAARGVALERGRRLWVSTDAVVPSRAGHPTATLAAVDRRGLLPNYHLPTDVPAHVDLDGVTAALDVAEALVRDLGAERG